MNQNEKLILCPGYPHSFCVQFEIIQKMKGHVCFEEFSHLKKQYLDVFPEEKVSMELKLLEIAFDEGIISGLIEKNKKPSWEKRVFLKLAVSRLYKRMGERDGVRVVESLMYYFHWDFYVEMERKWEIQEDDLADFHQGKKGGKNPVKEKKENRFEQKSWINILEKKNKTDSDDSNETEKNMSIPIRKEEDGKKRVVWEDIVYSAFMSPKTQMIVKKAMEGNSAAQEQLGDFYCEEGTKHVDYDEAEKWYLLAADQGKMRAELKLGEIYNRGKENLKNPKKKGS